VRNVQCLIHANDFYLFVGRKGSYKHYIEIFNLFLITVWLTYIYTYIYS